MKKILATLSFSLFFINMAQAADVVCACQGETKCSDIAISFVPSNPGVYMTVEYAYGERNVEGFATIVRENDNKRVIYRLANFTLVESGGKFSVPGRPALCN